MDEVFMDIDQPVATALELLLLNANLLTPENKTVIQSHPKPNELTEALKSLQDEGILTQESFNEVQSHQKPRIAIKALKLLHKAGILTSKNRTIIQLDSDIRTRTSEQSADTDVDSFVASFLLRLFLDKFDKLEPLIKLSAIVSNLELFYSAEILTQENVDILRLHPDPATMYFLLTSLHQSKILTQENFDAIHAHSDLAQLNEVFELFNMHGVLTQENFESVLSNPHLKLISTLSKVLHTEGILTPLNLEIIFFDTGLLSTSSSTALSILYTARIFTQKNLDAVRQYTKKALLPFITLLLHSLGEAEILTQEYFELVLMHPDPIALYTTLQSLEAVGILNKENVEVLRLKLFAEPSVVADAFSSLHAAGILTQENIESIQSHVAPMKFAALFKRLQYANILSQENLEAIRRHPSPIKFIRVLRILSRVNILNQANLKRVQSLPDLQALDDAIFKLYEVDILTQENFMALFNHKILLMPGIWNRIPDQLITLEIFNALLERAGQANPAEQILAYIDFLVPSINDRQSTHTASVHYSVSESAVRLINRYGNFTEESLEQAITLVEYLIKHLSDDSSAKNKAAKRCIGRIISSNYTFLDPTSGISLRQLFFLIIFATVDKNNQYGSEQDAINRFIEGLYEIQRGYNLSEEGKDDGKEDKPICDAGAFNKLIEKLQGIHPDCEIKFMTSKTASLKLPIIVRETALQYLSQLANPANVADFLAFTSLIQQIKIQGVEIIWDKIGSSVMDKMFNEFSELYKYRENKALIDLVAAGLDTMLTDKTLNSQQKKIQNSSGYHQYCSQMLRQSRLFSSSANLSNQAITAEVGRVIKPGAFK